MKIAAMYLILSVNIAIFPLVWEGACDDAFYEQFRRRRQRIGGIY